MLSLPLLLGIIGAALFVWFWQNSLGARERANRAAVDACTRMHLQFLDGTVAFARLGVARNERGKINLRRTYIFDYTATSIERRQGFVVLLGMRVEAIGFAPDEPLRHEPARFPDSPHKPTESDILSDEPREQQGEHQSSNVLDLEQWRRRRNHPKPPDERSRSPNDSGW